MVRRCNKSCEAGGYPIKEGTYIGGKSVILGSPGP